MDEKARYCLFRETDYTQDVKFKSILVNENSTEALLTACSYIKEKEGSPILKIPSDLDFQYPFKKRELLDIDAAAKQICHRDYTAVLDCLEKLRGTPVLLQVSGAFSTLLSLTGDESLFRHLIKSEAEILEVIGRINAHTADLIQEAVQRGVNIISYADPSALSEVIGKKLALKYSVDATYQLMRLVDSCLEQSVMHICPRTSFALEKQKLCLCMKLGCSQQPLINELLRLSRNNNVHFTGHCCINDEKGLVNGLTVLKLLPPQD